MRLVRPLLAFGAALLLAACGGSDEAAPDLVFVSTRDGDYALYTMSTSEGDERRLTEAEGDPSTPLGLFFQTDPAWSPDGGTIAFASKRSGSFDLYAVSADGGDMRRLTSTKEDDDEPTWSPDGERIAFAGERGGVWNIWTVARRGRTLTQMTRFQSPSGYVRYPAWSPRGDRIVFERSIRESSVWMARPILR